MFFYKVYQVGTQTAELIRDRVKVRAAFFRKTKQKIEILLAQFQSCQTGVASTPCFQILRGLHAQFNRYRGAMGWFAPLTASKAILHFVTPRQNKKILGGSYFFEVLRQFDGTKEYRDRLLETLRYFRGCFDFTVGHNGIVSLYSHLNRKLAGLHFPDPALFLKIGFFLSNQDETLQGHFEMALSATPGNQAAINFIFGYFRK